MDPVVEAVIGRQLCVSCDPAQTSDFAALALARYAGSDSSGRPIIRLLGVHRSKKVSYEVQVAQVVSMTRRLMLTPYSAAGVTQIVDAGGAGKPFLDYLRAGSPLTANARGISMHGGMRSWTSQAEGITRASKVDVVTAINNAFVSRRLIYDPDMPGCPILEGEVLGLRQKQTAAGNIQIAAGRGNDDVLFAVAYIAYLMGEAPAGETAGWAESTVGYWDALTTSKPPADAGAPMPEGLLEARGEMDRPRRASYRFRW